MALLITTDLTGELSIVDGSPSFATICEDTEKVFLRRLLGDDIYKLFVADLNEATPKAPQSEPYVSLNNGSYYLEKNSSGNYKYKYQSGIKAALKYFAFCDFVRSQTYGDTGKGAAKFIEVNNNIITGDDLLGYLDRKYNKGVAITKELNYFINLMNQPVEITGINGKVLSTPDTRFLSAGDTITVGGVDTKIDSVVANTSITVLTTVSGNYWLKEYFEDWVLDEFSPKFAGGFF